MSFYKNPYDTPTFGLAFKPKDIVNEITKELVIGNLGNAFDFPILKQTNNFSFLNKNSSTVLPLTVVSKENIRSFFAPIIVNHKDSVYIVNDYRLLVNNKQDFSGSSELTIKSGKIPDFNLRKDLQVIAGLNYLGNNLKPLSFIPQKVFSMWLSVSISRRYNLDFKDQYILNLIFSIWFNSLFVDTDEFKGEDLENLLANIVSNQNHDRELLEQVKAILEDGFKLRTINDALVLTKKFITNITYVKDFNLNVLMTLISNTYYGLNGKELIAMSLEYPGIFMAILYNVVTDKTFKKSVLMTISEKFNKKEELTSFITQYNFTIKNIEEV